jgi:hypothetical protein
MATPVRLSQSARQAFTLVGVAHALALFRWLLPRYPELITLMLAGCVCQHHAQSIFA